MVIECDLRYGHSQPVFSLRESLLSSTTRPTAICRRNPKHKSPFRTSYFPNLDTVFSGQHLLISSEVVMTIHIQAQVSPNIVQEAATSQYAERSSIYRCRHQSLEFELRAFMTCHRTEGIFFVGCWPMAPRVVYGNNRGR